MSGEYPDGELICLPCAAAGTLVSDLASSVWSVGECSRCGQHAQVTEIVPPPRPFEPTESR